ncbi:unnamed protein product, partial [Prorocentrum cordatum]
LSKPFDVSALIANGVLDSKCSTVAHFARICGGQEYSDEEIGFLMAHCEQEAPIAVEFARAVSGSEDRTLEVWDLAAGTCERTLAGHQECVRCVALAGPGRAVSGPRDKTLKVWDLAAGTCERTLAGHQHFVICVALAGPGRAVSGSIDRTVKGVKCVALAGPGRAVSGSADTTLKVWDLAAGTCERTLAGHQGWVECVALAGPGRA